MARLARRGGSVALPQQISQRQISKCATVERSIFTASACIRLRISWTGGTWYGPGSRPCPRLTFRKSWQLASSINLCLTKHSWLAPLAHKKSRVKSRKSRAGSQESRARAPQVSKGMSTIAFRLLTLDPRLLTLHFRLSTKEKQTWLTLIV